MNIQKMKLKDLKPAPYNPRKIKSAEREKLKTSIKTYDLVEPLVYNCQTGNVVGGNQKLVLLPELGYEEVEVVVVDLPLEKEKLLNMALNRIQGEWDEDKLAALLDDLMKMPDVDVSLSGFDIPEISQLFDKMDEVKEDDFNFDEELEKIDKPVTEKGDLMLLGKHRLLCGDSSDDKDIAKLVGSDKVGLIFTDPPYNVNYYGGNRPNPKVRPKPSRQWSRIYNDNLTQEEYEVWLGKIFGNVTPHLAAGAPSYIWNGHRQFGPMHLLLTKLGFHISTIITWAKENFAIGYGDYNQQTEFALYGWLGDNGAHRWYGPNNESTLWQIKRDSTSCYEHPTQKPVALAYRAIKNSSQRGDVVLDMFLGSGTTLIASEQLQRACYGLEIDPGYCDVIARRYINFVGVDKVSPEIRDKYITKEVAK